MFVAAGQPQYLEIQGGARITQGGANSPPTPPKYTPVVYCMTGYVCDFPVNFQYIKMH